MLRMGLAAGSALFLLFIPHAHAAPEEGKRVALIIGNDSYSVSPLQNGVNDARAMDKALQGAGFRTILRENATKVVMEQATAEFLQGIGPTDTALFFYAGHAVQIESENHLIPVDFAAANSVIEAKYKSFSLGLLFDYLKRSRVKRSIVIIDACRSNPVAEAYSLEGGLAPTLDAGKETYMAYSTSPNHVATDNPDGKNSWFTEALADLISQPGLVIDEVFTRVRLRVEKATGGKQTPWSNTNLTGRFYFHPPKTEVADDDPTVVEKLFQDAQRQAYRENWSEAIELLQQVLKKQPDGPLEQTVNKKLAYAKARSDALARFEARDFAASAGFYEQALKIEPFLMDAAFEAVNSYLLNDQLSEAVRVLMTIRVRGTSAASEKAQSVLKELAVVYPEAEKVLKSGAPQPPPVQEIFGDTQFGIPDWHAGRRYLQASPVELTRWVKQLTPAPPESAPANITTQAPPDASAPSAAAPITPGSLHLEVLSLMKTRDLVIRRVDDGRVNTSGVMRPSGTLVKVTTDPPGAELTLEGDSDQRCQSPCMFSLTPSRNVIRAHRESFKDEMRIVQVKPGSDNNLHIPMVQEFGFVELSANQPQTMVLLDGKPASTQVPVKLRVPVGRYEIRAVREGKIVNTKHLEVRPASTVQVALDQ